MKTTLCWLLSITTLNLNGSPKYNLDLMTYLSTHVESDATTGGKYAGNLKMHDALVHDAVYRCSYVKKLAYQWQLYSHASDLYLSEAIDWLNDLNLADSFYLTDLTKNHFSTIGSTSEKINLSSTITEFRETAYDFVSSGQMKACYSDNEYRKHKSGLTEADIKNLGTKTDTLVTWYFYLVVRYVQFTANSVWKDVVGENIDFTIKIPSWTDLSDSKKKNLKDLESMITDQVGPSFKVLENSISEKVAKKQFVQFYRNILDTYVYLHYTLGINNKQHLYNKLSLNIINLKADGNLLMDLLEKQKFLTGDELKQAQVVHSLINQLGNALEAAYIWTDLFKRDHDDSLYYKKAVDDYSFCSLINYRNKFVNYIQKVNNEYTNNIYDKEKDTNKTYDMTFFKNVAIVYPMYAIDALNKTPNDEDDDLKLKKGLAKAIDVYTLYAQMLSGPFTNIFVTHAYNKADVVKEFSAVYNRYRNVFIWNMKHGVKTIKNKMFMCKGCGGLWALEKMGRETKFYNQVTLSPSDKTQFMVSHRIVASSSMIATYRRLYTYKFEIEVSGDQKIISDVRVPSKLNNTLYAKISGFLISKDYSSIKYSNINKDVFIETKTFNEFLEFSKNLSPTLTSGNKVSVFKESGRSDLCIQDLINDTNVVITDKHQYSYVVLSKKDLDTSAFKGCTEISLVKASDLDDNGLHYPVFVSRLQEWKKFDIMWTYRSQIISEGVEDYGNKYGVSYMTFYDAKDVNSSTFDAPKFQDYLDKANSKRDLTAYGLALNNQICVYKNNKKMDMEAYMNNNLKTVAVNIKAQDFNNNASENDVTCSDLDKHLNFSSLKSFNESIAAVQKLSPTLTQFASCGSYRKTEKMHHKGKTLYLVNKGGKIKEQQHDTKSFQVGVDYYLHARISPSFKFTDYLKIKLFPAFWLKIKPIKLGNKNSFLFIDVLVSPASSAKYLGLSANYNPLINLKPKFNFPGFNKAVDFINTNLTMQLYTKGMTLANLNKRVDGFIRSNAQTTTKHREFVKVKYDHSVADGCDSHMKGISIQLTTDYKIKETCGTNEMVMDDTYYVEILYVSSKEAKKLKDKKFLPPTETEINLAGQNGYVLYNSGRKYDVLDVQAGFIKYRIWARPNLTLPYELVEKK